MHQGIPVPSEIPFYTNQKIFGTHLVYLPYQVINSHQINTKSGLVGLNGVIIRWGVGKIT